MERLLQYIDDLDDLWGMVGLISERLRNIVLVASFCTFAGCLVTLSVRLAIAHPPLALATSTLLFVTLLYRSVTAPWRNWRTTA